jgi:hypothetical protein
LEAWRILEIPGEVVEGHKDIQKEEEERHQVVIVPEEGITLLPLVIVRMIVGAPLTVRVLVRVVVESGTNATEVVSERRLFVRREPSRWNRGEGNGHDAVVLNQNLAVVVVALLIIVLIEDILDRGCLSPGSVQARKDAKRGMQRNKEPVL